MPAAEVDGDVAVEHGDLLRRVGGGDLPGCAFDDGAEPDVVPGVVEQCVDQGKQAVLVHRQGPGLFVATAESVETGGCVAVLVILSP